MFVCVVCATYWYANSARMHVCVCVCVYMHLREYACAKGMDTFVCMCVRACMCAYTFMLLPKCMHVCCVCMHAVYACMQRIQDRRLKMDMFVCVNTHIYNST